jgi:hypothetical protein
VLSGLDYRMDHEISASKKLLLMKNVHHHHLFNSQSRIIVELHWTIAPRYYDLEMDTAQILKRIESRALMGRQILELSAEDSIILISQHGAKHVWSRLSWICDMAGLIRDDGISLINAIQKMKAAGEERIILLGLLLAEELLGSKIPSDISLTAKCDRAFVDVSQKILQRLISEISLSEDSRKDGIFQSILYMNLYSRPTQKACFFLRMISDPVDYDMSTIELPDRALPLYRLVKILRMMMTYRGAFCRWMRESMCLAG